ncbi:sucrase/ferredoxin-like family protein Fmi1 [Tirmania nivea]|nr:sucrase/ferredoxin-like family protein Fmi1 [Tirmania nivea]
MSAFLPRLRLPLYSCGYLYKVKKSTFATPSQRHISAIASEVSASQEKCDCVDISKLDIDWETPLKGTIAAYNTHVLASTGKSDWKSKIELEGGLVADLKRVLGKVGLKNGFNNLRDPNNVILTTNSSYRTSPSVSQHGKYSSAYVFPQNIYLPVVPLPSSSTSTSEAFVQFIQAYLLPAADTLAHTNELPHGPRKVHETHILICTHNSRDTRCGIIGPMLNQLFTDYLSSKGLLHPEDPNISVRGKVRVGNISHIGGHKYAGNVIVYLPPDKDNWNQGGKGIWYGRVGRQADVERIVDETVLGGKIIQELLRGGVGI